MEEMHTTLTDHALHSVFDGVGCTAAQEGSSCLVSDTLSGHSGSTPLGAPIGLKEENSRGV